MRNIPPHLLDELSRIVVMLEAIMPDVEELLGGEHEDVMSARSAIEEMKQQLKDMGSAPPSFH